MYSDYILSDNLTNEMSHTIGQKSFSNFVKKLISTRYYNEPFLTYPHLNILTIISNEMFYIGILVI